MLCSTCAEIDFAEYFQRDVDVHYSLDSYFVEPGKSAHCLGSLTEIHNKASTCQFCRLVFLSICRRWERNMWRNTPQELLDWARNTGVGEECYMYSFVYASSDGIVPTMDEPEPGPEHEPRIWTYRIGIGLRRPVEETTPYLDHAANIQLLGTCAAELGLSDMFHGRLVDTDKADMSLCRRWLQICESRHGLTCQVPAFALEDAFPDPPPDDLLVVDVRHMCLYRMLPGERYVALSYCWPNSLAGKFVTNLSNITGLFLPGSLEEHVDSFSSPIKDAISVVRELGEDYLWVDALCIVQDDVAQKEVQIRQMDCVYGAAILTIICAPGSTPLKNHDGLPGFRSGSRLQAQVVGDIKGLVLTNSLIGLDLATTDSPWDSRAWTFQEHRLSRRKLFFTEMQTYFQCSCSVFCEDAIGEECPQNAFVYAEASLWNTCNISASHYQGQDDRSTWISRSPAPYSPENMDIYRRLFDQYSGRDMSEPGDIVFAFQGILSLLERTTNTRFLAGLPEAHFHEALLWFETGKHESRRVLKGGDMILPYPSWSWAGWMTSATYENLIIGDISAEADWYVVDEQTGFMVEVDALSNSGHSLPQQLGTDNKHVKPPEPSSCFLELIRSRETMTNLDQFWGSSHRLACWSSIAVFQLTEECTDLNELGGTAWLLHENTKILNDAGECVGSILIRKDYKVKLLNDKRHFDFMLLSRSRALGDARFFDEDLFPVRDWCYLNVMLIQQSDGVACRVGIGFIHEDAWIEANPIATFVKLE